MRYATSDQIAKLQAEADEAERKWLLTRGTSGGRANFGAYVRVKACLVGATAHIGNEGNKND